MNREISSDKILRMRTVLERAGLSRSTVYRKVQEGAFPPKVKLRIMMGAESGSPTNAGGGKRRLKLC